MDGCGGQCWISDFPMYFELLVDPNSELHTQETSQALMGQHLEESKRPCLHGDRFGGRVVSRAGTKSVT